MPECMITSVDSDDSFFKPVIATFQNGQLQSNQVDSLQCVAFSNNKTKQKIVAVATEKMTYIGQDNTNSELCYTLLTIRNKRTNKVRIVPVSNISLSAVVPKINSVLDSTLNSSKSTIQDLNKQFGSKRTKLRTEQIERMRMNVSNVEKELQQTVADIKFKPEDLVRPVADDNDKFYRPPMNRNASSVEEVYDLNAIISQDELDTLSDFAATLLENEIESDKFAPFVSETINYIKTKDPPNKLHKIEVLLYMDAILKFFKMPIKSIGKRKVVIEPYPELISSKVMKEYTVLTDNNRTRPISMRDKATCYCIVMALILFDYKLDLELLSKSLGVGVKKLCDVSRMLGAQNRANKPKSCIVLKLPLPVQQEFTGKRKK